MELEVSLEETEEIEARELGRGSCLIIQINFGISSLAGIVKFAIDLCHRTSTRLQFYTSLQSLTLAARLASLALRTARDGQDPWTFGLQATTRSTHEPLPGGHP